MNKGVDFARYALRIEVSCPRLSRPDSRSVSVIVTGKYPSMDNLRRHLAGRCIRSISSHWIWTIPVILIVASLAFDLIDIYPPTFDEHFSIIHSNLVNPDQDTITDVVAHLYTNNEHTAFYFLLLHLWGKFCSYDIAILRIMSVFFSLLGMAVIGRLAREYVGKAAGLFAVVVVASNAFYNFYVPHLRMYSLLVLLAAIVLWQYLRTNYGRRPPSMLNYLILFVASYALANTHLFSALFFITLGAYHLLLAPKNWRWLLTSLAVCLAVLLFLPWLFDGIPIFDSSVSRWSDADYNGFLAVKNFMNVFSNGNSFMLIGLSLVGLAIGYKSKLFRTKPYIFLLAVFLLAIAALAQIAGYLSQEGLRFLLSGLPPFALFAAAGIFGLHRHNPWLGLVILLWVLSGIVFHNSVPFWASYVAGRTSHFDLPPWQIVSRMALESGDYVPILSFGYKTELLKSPGFTNYSQHELFFGRHGIPFQATENLNELLANAHELTITEPSLWVVFDDSAVDPVDADRLREAMEDLGYGICGVVEPNHRLLVLQYMWDSLHCQTPDAAALHSNALINYEFFGVTVSEEGQRLIFVDRWEARADFDLLSYRLSFQLINKDWENVAQLDISLVHEGGLRRFWIDASHVPPGNYSLVAILYNSKTGERVPWTANTGYVPEMLTLNNIRL